MSDSIDVAELVDEEDRVYVFGAPAAVEQDDLNKLAGAIHAQFGNAGTVVVSASITGEIGEGLEVRELSDEAVEELRRKV